MAFGQEGASDALAAGGGIEHVEPVNAAVVELERVSATVKGKQEIAQVGSIAANPTSTSTVAHCAVGHGPNDQ